MILLFDIGGTKTRIILSDGQKLLDQPIIFFTNADFESGYASLLRHIHQLIGSQKVERVVGGIAGSLDETHSQLNYAGNLTGWVNHPLKLKLEQDLDCPAFLENDAALCGLGEARFGAGQDFREVLYLTVSTGVGGTHIIGGRLDPKAFGFEPGRDIFPGESALSLEALISGKALQQKYGVETADQITDPKVWEEAAQILAKGLAKILLQWNPEVVVLGGSLVENFGIKVVKVQQYLKEEGPANPPKIIAATLADLSGLYGALALSQQL